MNIYYFSGTGNSIAVCKEIQNHFPDSILVPIAALLQQESITDVNDAAGIVFPTYYMDAPDIVKAFLKKTRFKPDAYLFAAVHYGLEPGNSLASVAEILREQGSQLAMGWNIQLPDNSILFKTPLKKQPEMHSRLPENVEKLCIAVRNRVTRAVPPHKRSTAISGKLGAFLLRKIAGTMRKRSDKNCTGCGICMRICPVNNIFVKEKRAYFSNRCAECFGCIHWCPTRAIRYGLVRVNDRSVYRNPSVTPENLEAQKTGHHGSVHPESQSN